VSRHAQEQSRIVQRLCHRLRNHATILDIHLEDAGAIIDNAGMIQALVALVPRFSIYLITFLICTVA
jgi:hypothetical protein